MVPLTDYISPLTQVLLTYVSSLGFITQGQYWPSGIIIACVCVCVRQLFFVRTITHLTFQLHSSNLDQKIQQILLKVPIVLVLIDPELPGQI